MNNIDSFVVHAPTKKIWEKINNICIFKGYNWDGASARKFWHVNGEKSCIRINHETKKMSTASKRFYEREECIVFTSKDFMSLYNRTNGFFGSIRILILKIKFKLGILK